MNENQIFIKIKQILSKQLSVDIDSIKMESNISSDLGADSLDTAEIAMVIKDDFDYDLSDDEMLKIKTVKDIVEILIHKKNT